MPRKSLLIDAILSLLNPEMPAVPYENVYDWMKRRGYNNLKRNRYQETVWKLQRHGILKISLKNNQRFIKLTGKGQLAVLLQKAGVQKLENWDGKWRVLIFDIPEGSRNMRDQFRALLKRHNFVKLQASVFVSPYSLNGEAVQYLKQTGLIEFVRLMRVDEIDDDRELKKKFNLNHSVYSRP